MKNAFYKYMRIYENLLQVNIVLTYLFLYIQALIRIALEHGPTRFVNHFRGFPILVPQRFIKNNLAVPAAASVEGSTCLPSAPRCLSRRTHSRSARLCAVRAAGPAGRPGERDGMRTPCSVCARRSVGTVGYFLNKPVF